jgi:exosortase
LTYLALADPEIQYVLLVPFTVAFFFYKRRKAFLVSRKASWHDNALGFSLCSLALIIYIWGSYSFYILPLHLISLPIFIAGTILLIFGPSALRLLVFPTFLIIFLTPFPSVFLDMFGVSLIDSAATISTSILRLFLPIELSYRPVVTLSTFTNAGQKVSFEIAAACSGIYSLMAIGFFAVIFLYITSGSLTKKGIFAGLSLFTAYGLNVLRILLTLVLGYFFGYGLAVNFFHLFGGVVILFFGTLILLFVSDKLLKLSVFQGKRPSNSPNSNEPEDFCWQCIPIFRLPKIRLEWKSIFMILVFLAIMADLIFQASIITYGKGVNTKNPSIDFNISTGNTNAFSNLSGWSPLFVGREYQAEERLGLKFVGDYILFGKNNSETITAILELSDAQSKFHTWEGCLNYQAYEIDIEKTFYSTIYDQNNTIVTAETLIANVPAYKQKLIVMYWFDSLNLRTNETTNTYAVKGSLLKYVYYGTGQVNATQVEAASNELLTLAKEIETTWSAYKTSPSSFVVDIYRNKEASTVFVVGTLIFTIAAVQTQTFITKTRALRKARDLPKEDRDFLITFHSKKPAPTREDERTKILDETAMLDKIQKFKQEGLLREQIIMKNGQLYVKWKSF